MTDKSIAAQQALETARQNFQKAESALDRTQQTNTTNAQIQAQKDLQTAQQTFTAAQSKLDRDQQSLIVNLQSTLNQANVSKNFAATLALNTSNSINTIANDANLNSTPDGYLDSDGKYVANTDSNSWPAGVKSSSPKTRAIQNVVDHANSTMQWGSTFYNTTLPTVTTPGGTGGVVTPGAGAGGGTTTSTTTNSGPTFPYNIASYSGPQKAQVYKDLMAQGYSDTAIRSAWEARVGSAVNSDEWDSLKSMAGTLR